MISFTPEIEGLINSFPYPAIFIFILLGSIGFPFPEDAILILSGFLISDGVIGLLPAFIVIYSGLLLSDFLLYSVGKKYGRMIVAHKRFKKIVSAEKLSFFEKKFNDRGALLILVGRHIVGLRTQIFLAAGVMKMPPLKFLIMDAVSSVLTIGLMVGAGYIGGNSLQVVKQDVAKLEHMAILVVVIALAVYMLYRFFKSRKGA